MVTDLGSTNGTEVGGQRIHEPARIVPGQEVVLGGVHVRVHAAAPADLGLDSHERFRAALDDEVKRARYFHRSLAVLTVRAGRADLHVSEFLPRVRERLREVDRVALYSGDTVEILCPEIDAEGAMDLARAVAEGGPHEGGPLLVGLAVFPATGTKAEELIERSWTAAHRAERDRPVEPARTDAWGPEEPALRAEDGDEPVAGTKLRVVLDAAIKFARAKMPVLIQGETGAGKEVVAHAIHAASSRRHKRMIVLNCGAIPEQLVESTLFGHMKGAFTGAGQDQKGVFEVADGSTVFLDEIGELSLGAQKALLRVLETHRFTRVGAARETEVDVRVIAATHRDLEAMCDKGTFRQDLLFRLNPLTVTVPPLRDRPDELEPLVTRFLREANHATGSNVRGLAPAALAVLQRYRWPGNVRELRNAIHRAVAIAHEDVIGPEDLPERIACAADRAGPVAAAHRGERAAPVTPTLLPTGLKPTMKQVETRLILDALEASGGVQTEAAKLLKLPLRTLAHKIRSLGIRRPGFGTLPT